MLRLVQKKNRPEKFPFIAKNKCIVLVLPWSVKEFFCSEFLDIPEKSWRRRRKPTIVKDFAFQTNASAISKYQFFSSTVSDCKSLKVVSAIFLLVCL